MASELITKLQEVIAEHGDLPVYSEVDWDWVHDAEFTPNDDEIFGHRGAHIRLQT